MFTFSVRVPLFIVLAASTTLALSVASSGASVPVGANFTVPDDLVTGYYQVLRSSTTQDPISSSVRVDATYADLLKMLKGTAANANTEEVLKPYVQETQEIHYLQRDLAVKAGFLAAEASFSSNDLLIVERWSKFVNVVIARPTRNGTAENPPPTNSTIPANRLIRAKVGFSITLVTKASLEGTKLDAGRLVRNLTLQASRDRVSLTSHTEVMGLSGRDITAKLPSASEFLSAQAQAAERARADRTDVMQARNQAFLKTAADFFSDLRDLVWDASYVQPIIIAIDEDDLKTLVD
jgi:hypothetical protein